MTKQSRFFLDTTAVYYARHGHSLMKKEIAEAVGDGVCEVSKFIRMEYLRSTVASMIDLYVLIKQSASVDDALKARSQDYAIRRVKLVLITIEEWLTNHEGYKNKMATLRRLGDAIVRMLEDFDHEYPSELDPVSCEIGRLSYAARTFYEDAILEFREEIRRIAESTPTCSLCRFRLDQLRYLRAEGIDLYSEQRRQEYKGVKAYVKLAKLMEKAATAREAKPACRWCKKLGDAIIALHCPEEATLVSADQAFGPLCKILNKKLHPLRSLTRLQKAASTGCQPAGP